MGRIIAFDIGDKRVGVAMSDPLGIMALPQKTYWRKGYEKDIVALCELAKANCAEKIVCGLPLNFGLKTHTDIPIVTADERFTTLMARRVLIEADMRREKRKEVIDSIAASYILEDYLKRQENK